MKKIFQTLIFSVFSITFCLGQNGTIEGKVAENSVKQTGVPFAHILFQNTKTSFLDSTYTDFNGDYKIKLPHGSYTIKIDYLGFLPYFSEKIKIKNNRSKTINISLVPTLVEIKMNAVSHPFPRDEK